MPKKFSKQEDDSFDDTFDDEDGLSELDLLEEEEV